MAEEPDATIWRSESWSGSQIEGLATGESSPRAAIPASSDCEAYYLRQEHGAMLSVR